MTDQPQSESAPSPDMDEAVEATMLTCGDHIGQFFSFRHLPERLQNVSRPFANLACAIVQTIPRNPERTVALRKLLEAKDAAVRAYIAK